MGRNIYSSYTCIYLTTSFFAIVTLAILTPTYVSYVCANVDPMSYVCANVARSTRSRRSSGPPPPPRSTASTPACRSPSTTGRTDWPPPTRADISPRGSVVGKCGAAANAGVAADKPLATSFVAHSQIWWCEFEEREDWRWFFGGDGEIGYSH
jgi:hypothetical protein